MTHNQSLWNIDRNWTLFLDRDGTINQKLEGKYISKWEDFKFLPGAIDAISSFNRIFQYVIIVTNQQGIGKELMTEEELRNIHSLMLKEINDKGGIIDEVYHCPMLEIYNPLCRKPNPGMAITAQQHFPEIQFKKSVMVGDSISDMIFGKNMGMKTVFLNPNGNNNGIDNSLVDLNVLSLSDLVNFLIPLPNK